MELSRLDNLQRTAIISTIKNSLEKEENIIFAYLYGSFAENAHIINDIDIGVYCRNPDNPFSIQTDLKILISNRLTEKGIELSPDDVDIKVINNAPYYIVIEILERGLPIVDKNPALRAWFIEKISLEYRINEIILNEVYKL